MAQCTVVLLAVLCGGCATGIPDADPPVPPVKPCQVVVIQEPRHVAACLTREQFEHAMKGVLY